MTSNPQQDKEEGCFENRSTVTSRLPGHLLIPNMHLQHVICAVQHVMDAVTCVVLDVEGTTTSLKFVRDVLVPYVESHLADFIKENWEKADMLEVVQMLYLQSLTEEVRNVNGFIYLSPIPEYPTEIEEFQESLVAHIKWLMQKNFKSVGLKMLQSFIWKEGFESREIVGDVYEDAANVIKMWHEQKKKIFIYSSATVETQRLLFRNSVHGNLESFIHSYFDLTIGSKTEKESYVTLLQGIGESPNRVVFFSDRPKEIMAAKAAGMHGVLVVRDADNPYVAAELWLLDEESWSISSFEELPPHCIDTGSIA